MSFKIGDRVGNAEDIHNFNPDESPNFGEVVDLTTKGLVIVKWDHWTEQSDPMDPTELVLESEVQAAQTELEAQFNKYQAQVEKKYNQAVAALLAAQELAKKAGCDVADMVDKYSLGSALYDAGWSGSTFAC